MAYVPGYEHDVFVSYAHIDNEDRNEVRSAGWVDAVKAELEDQLRRRLGSREVRIWIDDQLAANQPVTPEIVRQVAGSALLLVVLSPGYLRSEWCARERNAFLRGAQERFNQGRLFVIQNLDVDRRQWPAELGDLAGFKFWVRDPELHVDRPLGAFDRRETAFLGQIYLLSVKMAEVLGAMAARAHEPALPQRTDDRPQTGVFVARATDDLEDREQELRNYLTQAGLRVVPRRVYTQSSRDEFEAAVRAEMAGCSVFAQLLGPARGPEMPFDEERRLPALLAELARRQGLTMRQWRDRGVDPGSIADAGHRALVEAAMACPIEEFKRSVADAAAPPAAPVQRKRPPKVIVFVDRAREDHALAEQVASILTGEGAQVYFPIDQGSAEEIRDDLERSLKDADGVLEVFGASELTSVRARMRQHTKLLAYRDSDPAALAVLEGPPAGHERLEQLRASVSDPTLLFIDSAEGVRPDQLEPFISRLRAARDRHA